MFWKFLLHHSPVLRSPERQWENKQTNKNLSAEIDSASGLLPDIEKEVAFGKDILRFLGSGKRLGCLISGLERVRLEEKV